MPVDLRQLAREIADRSSPRSEQDVASRIAMLLRVADLNLRDEQVRLESPAPDRRRIDVEVGATVIETKRNLSTGTTFDDGRVQLAGYVADRQEQAGGRYVGVLTDGQDWHAFHLDALGGFHEVTTHRVVATDPDVQALVLWLEGILATRQDIPPTQDEIANRLGADSSSFRLDIAELDAIYEKVSDQSEVQVKRELWSRLLAIAYGTRLDSLDESDARLFTEHTYLVVVAELVAHAVMDFDLAGHSSDPQLLLSGRLFADSQVGGVVEQDFFDWLTDVPQGRAFVSSLARRIARFDWTHVDHDVLKVLYESVIGRETRHDLGEYYTPDWLAEAIVSQVVDDPATQRVLDPACGSGTFLFHTVRRALDACEQAGMSTGEAIRSVTSRVFGIDVHPVAVTLARVTYLLAIGRERLRAGDRGRITVPVYLGDSLQFDTDESLLSGQGLLVHVDEAGTLISRELRFPDRLLDDVSRFDVLLAEMTQRVQSRNPDSPIPDLSGFYSHHGVHPDDWDTLDATFSELCALHDDGRNHIWGYYVRNLARPRWLSREGNRVDRIVGNPPWLSYRYMAPRLKERFRQLSVERDIWAGGRVATHQDLSALFVVRSVELYLGPEGRFGMVMPLAALSRQQYAGFWTGHWRTEAHDIGVRFGRPWDLDMVNPHPFPVPSAVVFGRRPADRTWSPLDGPVIVWRGQQPGPYEKVPQPLVRAPEREEDWSHYKRRFFNGATVYPRLLFIVEERDAGPLGVAGNMTAIESWRSPFENEPWKSLDPIRGQVESRFLLPTYLSASLLPFRLGEPHTAVIPWTGQQLVAPNAPQIDQWPGLAEWMRTADALWLEHRTDESNLSLLEQLNYLNKLTNQFPASSIRVVYNKSGSNLMAAILDDPRAVVENKLYWATASSYAEARYLTAVLNAPVTANRVAPLQSRGAYGTRDFDLYPWALPFPVFDPDNELHQDLVATAEESERVSQGMDVEGAYFVTARSDVAEVLEGQGLFERLNGLVTRLLADQV